MADTPPRPAADAADDGGNAHVPDPTGPQRRPLPRAARLSRLAPPARGPGNGATQSHVSVTGGPAIHVMPLHSTTTERPEPAPVSSSPVTSSPVGSSPVSSTPATSTLPTSTPTTASPAAHASAVAPTLPASPGVDAPMLPTLGTPGTFAPPNAFAPPVALAPPVAAHGGLTTLPMSTPTTAPTGSPAPQVSPVDTGLVALAESIAGSSTNLGSTSVSSTGVGSTSVNSTSVGSTGVGSTGVASTSAGASGPFALRELTRDDTAPTPTDLAVKEVAQGHGSGPVTFKAMNDVMATRAVIFSIIGMVLCFLPVLSLAGLVMGVLSSRRIKRSGGALSGATSARFAIIVGAVGLAVGVVFDVVFIVRG